jgi:hypothetical protein
MQNVIKSFILETLRESNDKDKAKEKKPKNLLTEPDFDHDPEEDPASQKKPKEKKDEFSAGGVAGATVPLGANSASYPDSRVGKTKHKF